MIKFKTLRFKNFLSYGNAWAEFNFDLGGTVNLLFGKNGQGKCLRGGTKITVNVPGEIAEKLKQKKRK